jgi:hypothetical protein
MRLAVSLFLACGLAFGQVPRIGTIDFYGLRKLPAAKLRQELGIQPGDPLPPSKANVEERLETIEGVVRARLEAVCCEAKAAILFVGIEERGAPHFEVREAPESEAVLPEEMTAAYRAFLDGLQEAVVGRPVDPEFAGLEERLAALVKAHLKELRTVLRTSADAGQRAIAAHALVVSSDRPAAAQDLQYALQDPDEDVRRNALNSLGTLAAYAVKHPDSEIRIAPTWPIEMLNSIVWSDRVGAVNLLLTLSEGREPGVLDLIRQRASPQLVEMARWNSLTHALPAYILLGRIAGWPENEIQESWSKGDREARITALEREWKTGR